MPEGSGLEGETSGITEEDTDEEEEEEEAEKYAFPELDSQIRQAIAEYGAVFPRLNFSSPKDAAWILPPGSPMKCTSPADVYLLLKSSDFTIHDLNRTNVFDGCSDGDSSAPYDLELVLRKWYSIDRSRECRCFVRDNNLIGITQRDMNFYEFWNDASTQTRIINTVKSIWNDTIKPKWKGGDHYVFDLLLTRDLTRAHIVDFNPYASRTDPLLFTYEELWKSFIHGQARDAPLLKVIDSRAHPAANSNVPANQHNMIPFEALSLASGRDLEEFSHIWQEEVRKSAVGDDE
ncbi:D123-domain-containing protein [Cylindrobasidium torrendii FP15055 ss-10]|uniref:D123-domain-containing protein n=1 Tax=Cylindrobasidium torrendii FP15055 ss-10 TaxID=1314674 RepID=A0A0D7BJ50_9AGAR|nr:D123-domain-containing protein [Cylindrobasidium torrendii FP15055 ss-10]